MRQILFVITLIVSGLFIFLFYHFSKSNKPHIKIKKAILAICVLLSLCFNCISGYYASFPTIRLNNTYIGEFSDLHYTLTWNGHHYTEQGYLNVSFSYSHLKFYGYAEDMHMVSPLTSKVADLIWPRKIYAAKNDKNFDFLYLKGRSSGSDRRGIKFRRTD